MSSRPYMDAPFFAMVDEWAVRFHISDVFIGVFSPAP